MLRFHSPNPPHQLETTDSHTRTQMNRFPYVYTICRASLVAQAVKNALAIQETWVQSLGREDPLEKGMATHSSILAWRIPWTEELGGLIFK